MERPGASAKPPRVHATAMVEEGVGLGPGTSVWDNVHVRGPGTRLGADCIVGGKTLIAYGVTIGNRCKINSNCYLCNGVTLGDAVMLGAGTTFTNDRFPRACEPDGLTLRGSEPDAHTLETTVGEGATTGAGVTIGPGLAIGRYAMIGMAAVVTRDVADFHLVVGSPARPVGAVCRCGPPLFRGDPADASHAGEHVCGSCSRRYTNRGGRIREIQVVDTPA
ncbi:acyltransferase [Phycisphaera mikurensis]|uniref:Putative acetyltransferase n=1 Tax=Phycisphaera mikurensis (strain NBRC 102666 / KCTC 22515 / FYK2301M01) TaxID=1142394 RepID=I0IFJ3_PHYMF|nr:acyltransferase [Phycisphaera mikurensis]MBB6440577.1 acetyltransferase-like isoleucine patch superfamily enzyme [Phycisphaera mikurensis]BAM04031.1 putative acetyltransferase [Phycisphaera mikurensis NBRC 102666]